MFYNKVIIIGHVGHKPEIRAANNGVEIGTFTMATTEKWKDKETREYKSNTTWVNVVVLKKNIIELLKNYVDKGSLIMIEGSLQNREYKDRQGNNRTKTEVILKNDFHNLMLINNNNNRSNDNGSSDSNASDNNGTNDRGSSLYVEEFEGLLPDDDIPF